MDISILETTTALLHLCRRRVGLLRETLQALTTCAPPLPYEDWNLAGRGVGEIEGLLDSIERAIKAQKEAGDGQHSD